MLFSDSFFTVTANAEALFKDRGSKFFAFAFPVTKETEIKQHLDALRRDHPGARHHCYAWRLGADGLTFRANDDGEPSSTAGKPILGQIQSKELTNILIVVIRYFGGTLLGAGGLINAYRSAAALVINGCEIVERFIMFEYELRYAVSDTSAVMRLLKEVDARITFSDYDQHNLLRFVCRKRDSEQLENKFSDLYAVKLKFLNIAG
jgi:uncharacterized YigZ family protein